jgi:uncharacterized protein YfiM (DUF2279 family)
VSPAIAVVLALSLGAQDRFFDGDKALHFGATAGISALGYGFAMLLRDDAEGRLVFGVSAGVLAGVVKELLDVRGLGDPSALDLAWDVIGTVTGTLLMRLVDWLLL